VSLKGLASELGLVPALELHRLATWGHLVQAMPLEAVPVVVLAQVQATMAGLAVVEALDRDPVALDTLKFSFSKKLESEPNTHF